MAEYRPPHPTLSCPLHRLLVLSVEAVTVCAWTLQVFVLALLELVMIAWGILVGGSTWIPVVSDRILSDDLAALVVQQSSLMPLPLCFLSFFRSSTMTDLLRDYHLGICDLDVSSLPTCPGPSLSASVPWGQPSAEPH